MDNAVMEHFDILIGLIGVLFTAIIGMYVWTFSVNAKNNAQIAKIIADTNQELGKIYERIAAHFENAKIHPNVDSLVTKAEFTATTQAMESDVKEIKNTIHTIGEDIKQLIKERS